MHRRSPFPTLHTYLRWYESNLLLKLTPFAMCRMCNELDDTIPDDMLIKLWNWDKSWSCQQVFEGHTHYVMQIVINPKDNNTFASASLDRTLKVSSFQL